VFHFEIRSYDWYFLVIPVIMFVWGLVWVTNIFGSADKEARFYRGRPEWFPILEGDQQGTHRIAGIAMMVLSGAFFVGYFMIH
jgi:hypothetical protein